MVWAEGSCHDREARRKAVAHRQCMGWPEARPPDIWLLDDPSCHWATDVDWILLTYVGFVIQCGKTGKPPNITPNFLFGWDFKTLNGGSYI